MDNQASGKKLPALNEVEGFNPLDYARILVAEDGSKSLYLEVKDRILWFRLHRPTGKIVPEVLNVTETFALVRCRVYASKDDPEDQFIGQAYAQRFRNSGDKFGDRFVEVAETAAIGRALAAAGYGTQFCGSADMLSGIISDAPIELPDEDIGEGATVSSRVVHQLRPEAAQTGEQSDPAPTPEAAQPAVAPQPAAQAPAAQPPAQPKADFSRKSFDELVATMTVDEAESIVVDFGKYQGSTLGQIAMIKPADLDWYARHYSGRNTALKAGAVVLLNAAQKQAS